MSGSRSFTIITNVILAMRGDVSRGRFVTESTNEFLAISFVVSRFLALVTDFCRPLIREWGVCMGGGEFRRAVFGRWCRELVVSVFFHRVHNCLRKAFGE